MKLVCLLRGINVGGKNPFKMATLKDKMTEAGFDNVVTYLNSGNVIFDSAISEEVATLKIQNILVNDFKVEALVAVFSAEDILEMSKHVPDWWGTDDKAVKHNAIFILPPTTVNEVIEDIGKHIPEYEQVDSYGQVVFWTANIKTFSRTKWSKLVGSKFYSRVTIRNSNTFKKLVQIISK
ncbi:DUF1697 domain-containing protein [Pediococcus argentinicus]|uniref:DUF1697 domain-containing protein n=1 Tax=Pediococcus argentinicus TaxID=480391 RepID=UPI00338E8FAD